MAIPQEKPVAFTHRGARRIKEVVERVRAEPRRSNARSAQRSPWTYGIVRAKVTTAIPSGTFASPSSDGEAQIHHKDATGAWAASGDPVKVWNDNPLDNPIPVGRTIKLGWIDGEWWAVSGACKNEV